MKLETRQAIYGVSVKVDETEADIYKNSNESNEFIQNLLETIEEVCKMRNENIYDYLENHYGVKISDVS